MAEPRRDAALAAFKQTFRQLAPYKHRYEVFRDFVTMAACSLHNSLHKDEAREEEYLRIIGQYKPDDQQAFPKLMAQLVAALDEEPRDILGPLYMELEIANKDAGQFFTPPEVSELMAQMAFPQELEKLATQDFSKRRPRPIVFLLSRCRGGLKRMAVGSSSGTTRRDRYEPSIWWA